MEQIINGIKPVFCGKKDCILEARYERTFFVIAFKRKYGNLKKGGGGWK